jgi:hypothetical protein
MTEPHIPENIEDFTLSGAYITELFEARTFTAQLAELADRLAQQAGEAVQRPLSAAQLQRAMEVNGAETVTLHRLLWTRWHELAKAGELPDRAFPVPLMGVCDS